MVSTGTGAGTVKLERFAGDIPRAVKFPGGGPALTQTYTVPVADNHRRLVEQDAPSPITHRERRLPTITAAGQPPARSPRDTAADQAPSGTSTFADVDLHRHKPWFGKPRGRGGLSTGTFTPTIHQVSTATARQRCR